MSNINPPAINPPTIYTPLLTTNFVPLFDSFSSSSEDEDENLFWANSI